MPSPQIFQEIVRDTLALVKQHAKRGVIELSPEVAARLTAFEARPEAGAPPAESAAAVTPAETPPMAPAAAETGPADEYAEALAEVAGVVRQCTKCGLSQTRTNTVFGQGNPRAQLVFVGEAPGADEDRQGLPFVGRAGQLLTDIIVKGMQVRREDVYICNVLKCRPPENRDPNPEEVYHCEPYLLQQLDILRPKVICALGRIAAQTLLKTNASTSQMRGKWHNYHGIPLRVTYHPAYLLRSPGEKRKTWEDVQEIMKLLEGKIAPDIPPENHGLA